MARLASIRTRIKICGITRLEDAEAAVSCGVDALGFVFYPPSKRAVTAIEAAKIIRELPAFVSVVGLFVNPEPEQVWAVLKECHLDVLQFHGEESAEFAQQFGLPYMTVVKVGAGVDSQQHIAQHPLAAGVLFDKYDPVQMGGTGEVFDWQSFERGSRASILAGGLDPNNVSAAIEQTRPFAVDVSSGVESAPGIKCADKIQRFAHAVTTADRRLCQSDDIV